MVPHSWWLLGFGLVVPEYIHTRKLPTNNEYWGLLYVSALLYLWRLASIKACPVRVQQALHAAFKGARVACQWYTIFCVVMVWELGLCVHNLWKYDWQGCGLKPPLVHSELPLWFLSSAPVVATVTFVILTVHVVYMLRKANQVPPTDPEQHWEHDVALIYVLLPGWFGLMCLFGFSRLWQIMSGTTSARATASDYLSLFHADVLLAELAEFLTIYVYCKLAVSHLLKHEEGEHAHKVCLGRPPLYWLTMNGVALCVILGMLKGGLQMVKLMATAFLGNASDIGMEACGGAGGDYALATYCRSSKALDSISSLASGAVVLCTYNMFFICKLPAVERALPHANLKFTGARLIVMLAQIQGGVLMTLSIDPRNYERVRSIGLSGYDMALLHLVLSQYELLFIVVFHLFIWTVWEGRPQKPPDALGYEPLPP